MCRRFLPVFAFVLGVCPVAAQTEAPPPHLSVLDGRAELTRGAERELAMANTPLVLGDQLATADGRAEVLLGDGSALHLDERTTVDFNGDTVLRLVQGRLIVISERGAGSALQIDASPASVRVQSSAEVHLTLFDDRGQPTLQVAVVRGLVEVDAGGSAVPVRAGQQVQVREGEAASYPGSFNSARLDGFARWSQGVFDSRRGAASTPYLPAEVRVYGSTFDQYGSWSYAAPYGYVWYPRVAHTWRPYYNGRWRHSGRYGWTFVGGDPWGWATHHYGRWGLSSGGSWYWIPSSGWGAAWVNWAVAPGYVGWCPLGWNNRPVRGFWGHGSRSAYAGDHPDYDPWRAWSVMPSRSFRGGVPVHHQRFDPRPFTGPQAPQFVVRPTPPSMAIPRGSVVAPGYRVAGPAVAPRAGQSRRGAPLSAAGSSDRAPSPAGPSRASSSPQSAAPPAVIYHRGAPADRRSGSSGAGAYERAGVAVPRGLPADRDRLSDPAAPASPYGGYTSPYSRGRGPEADTRTRGADHPDYAVPRGGDRTPATQYRAPERPQYHAPEPQSRTPDAPRSPAPERRGGNGESPRATPRSAPAPQAQGGGSRAHGAPAGRSSGGSSSGTAVPRRR